MRWLRVLIRLINVAAAIAVVAIGIGAWLLSSEKGTAWVVGLVERRAQPALAIASVDGTLTGGLELGGVSVKLPGRTLSADRVAMFFNPLSLLTGAIVVADLTVDHVSFRQAEGQTAGSGAGDLHLPVDVVVRRGRIGTLEMTTGGQTTTFKQTEFSLSLVRGRLRINRLSTNARGFNVTGRGTLLIAAPYRLTAQVGWSKRIDAKAWSGTVRLDGTPAKLGVHQELTSPFQLTADGTVSLGAEPSFDVDATWSDLSVPGVAGVTSPAGTAHAAGVIDRFQFNGEGDLRTQGQQGRFKLAGRRDRGRVLIDSLSIDGKPGKVSATGSAALDGTAVSLTVHVDDLDPATLAAGWPGRLAGTARVSGRFAPRSSFELGALDIGGRLRGVPVRLSGALAYSSPGRWEFDQLSLRSTQNMAAVSGHLGERWDMKVTASLSDAEQLLPQLGGSASVNLSASGTRAQPRLKGTVTGRKLTFAGFYAGSVRLQGDFGVAPDAPADLSLEAKDLRRGTLQIGALHARLSGSAARHRLSVNAQSEQWSAQSRVTGRLVAGSWQGSIDSLMIDQPALGRWGLPAPTAVQIGAEHVSVPRTCLVRAGASFCASLNLGGDSPDRLSATAKDFDLRVLRPLLPAGLSLQGVYQMSLSLEDLRTSPTGRLTVQGGRTVLRVPRGDDPNDAVETVIDSVGVDADLKDWRMRLNAKLSGRQSGKVDLSTDVADIRREDSPVSGNMRVSWPDLGIVSLLSPDLGQVGGSLSIDMTMGGTMGKPRISASAAWKDGSVAVPEWGFEVENIQATASSSDGTTLSYDAKGRAGEGTLALRGATQLSASSGWATRATLTGDSVRAVQLPDAQIFVTPDLRIDAHLPQVDVTGTVTVPRASLSLEQLPAQAVAPSGDVIVHGAQARAPIRPLHVNADLRISLGDKVHYTGSNLDVMLTGSMRLRYRSGQAEDATGAVSIDGKYSAYGQTLSIDRGRLVFNGPIDNPALDVRAVRKVTNQATGAPTGTQTVGVQLTGTLQSPESQIFSDPALSEQDALAYLLFGRSLTNTSQTDNPTLQKAALAMGLQQALPVVQRIGHTLGLDELTVGPTQMDTGALMAGKYLSPKVYVRYSYGLFNRIGGLLLRFRVNKRLSIETRSGEQKSMDLLYTVEKP